MTIEAQSQRSASPTGAALHHSGEEFQMHIQYQLSNGVWSDCGARSDEFVRRAAHVAVHGVPQYVDFTPADADAATLASVYAALEAGQELSIGSDWYARIRCRQAAERKLAERSMGKPPVTPVRCDCGHTVQKINVMSTARGTACPDCYDERSN